MAFPELGDAGLSLKRRVKIVLCGWQLGPEAPASSSPEREGSPVDRDFLRLLGAEGRGLSLKRKHAPPPHNTHTKYWKELGLG